MEERMKNVRSAGILLHISSLPGPYGIGDLGREAYAFADQLACCGQHYWQLLPVNPVHEEDFSPYSAIGSMAGNILFISPDELIVDGLLTEEQVEPFRVESSESVEYRKAAEIKSNLLELAYQAFLQQSDHPYHKDFTQYCGRSASWLDDYATYSVLCMHYGNKPWQDWNESHCQRHCALTGEQHAILQKEKWNQFVFDKQWRNLKAYCNKLNILLFGDLPIYVHPSAADVWGHPELFEVDGHGHMIGIAGVPPDYFNDKGQLWQMPVYNWERLKHTNYDWWVQRIRRNLEWFDVIRLDHFRGFSAYWRVEKGADTAIDGEWIPGPGNDLFDVLRTALGELPFVTEDLGLIDAPVRKLREDYGLPGMRVLQFAFGDDIATSEHIPHQLSKNTVLFTATHDNNTTAGWFMEETGKTVRKNLRRYTRQKVTAKNVAKVLSRLAYASVANTVILPMQDILGLPGSARMNTPSAGGDNWKWRMEPGAFTSKIIRRLEKWVELYGRNVKNGDAEAADNEVAFPPEEDDQAADVN